MAFGVGHGGIPDLNLGYAAQVEAGVGAGGDLPIDEQLEVTVVPHGGGVAAESVVEQFAGVNGPMRFAVLEGGEACGPFGNQGVALGGGKGHELAMVVGVAAAPASEIGPVKERCEAGGGAARPQDAATTSKTTK